MIHSQLLFYMNYIDLSSFDLNTKTKSFVPPLAYTHHYPP